MSSNWVGSSLGCKYQTKVNITESDKHSSLLRYIINNGCKSFYNTLANVTKLFVVMYDPSGVT